MSTAVMDARRDRQDAAAAHLSLFALAGVPLVRPGDDIAELILDGLVRSRLSLEAGDIVVVAQKIVSKAENRFVDLDSVAPSPQACALAAEVEKDPRLVELILAESEQVLRRRPGVLVVVHRRGYVLANAGIDASNVGPGRDDERVLLLPEDPDRSCREIRERLAARTGIAAGVIVSDSLGRAWRNGTIGTALGAAGLPARLDLRGRPDLFGRPLRSTEVGLADEIAAAASLLMGQADEARPIVLVRGLSFPPAAADSGADLIRDRSLDLFR